MNYLIIIIHFVSDWMLQPRSVARRKSSSWAWMLKHLLVILPATMILFLLGGLLWWLWLAILYTVLHGIQDKYIWRIYEWSAGPYTPEYLSHNKFAEDYWWYFMIAVDQIIHLLILFWFFSI